MRLMDLPASVEDYRRLAKRRLPRLMFDYIEGGSYSEYTVGRNIEAMSSVLLRQRVMRDVSKLNLATKIFGKDLSMPLVLGPVGLAGMYARRGEMQAARAAAATGIPFCLSTVSICGLSEIRRAAEVPCWFQLYMFRDRGFVQSLISEAADTGCTVLVLTVDVPKPGARHRDTRSGMYGGLPPISRAVQALGIGSHLHWMWNVYLRGRPHVFGNIAAAMPRAKSLPDFWTWVKTSFDASVTWGDVAWLRQHWKGVIVIKGIMGVEDAQAAVAAGADGIVVSNHGGRQLDGMASSMELLPAVVDAVGHRTTVLFDSGIRTGLDVLKALASGAKACLIGRAWAYGLAARGQQGVTEVLGIMRRELEMAMMMTGCTDVREAGSDLLENPTQVKHALKRNGE